MELLFDVIRDINSDTYIENRYLYSEFVFILTKQTGINIVSAPKPLPEIMDYASTETMAFHLSLQLQLLEEKGYTLLFWQPSDILVLENQMYLLSNLSQLVALHKKNTCNLVLNYPPIFPLPKNVCAPELLSMSGLPFITHRSASYYSMALLCLKILHLSLDDLQGTKLFYFLERCLKSEPSDRHCFYNLLSDLL
jgi:hypothetical protein